MDTFRKYFLGIVLGVVFSLSSVAQEVQPKSECYYYYEGEKIYLQRTDKLLLRFATSTNREQALSLIGKDISLQRTSDVSLEQLDFLPLKVVILESKDGIFCFGFSSKTAKSFQISHIKKQK